MSYNSSRVFLFSLILLVLPSPAFSFYESKQVELRGFAQLSSIATQKKKEGSDLDGTGTAEGRLLMDYKQTDAIAFELHLLTTVGLNEAADLVIDRFNMQWSSNPVNLVVGRQPINLATVFYFTPNDFFSPFSPETFFRVYKPGVDAARIDIGLNDLSLFSLIGVVDDRGESAASKGESILTRLSTDRFGFEWVALGGKVSERLILGGAFSGEIRDALGVRAEGHYANPDRGTSYTKLAVDLEHRFLNGLSLRIEQYYNGENERRAFFSSRDTTAIGLGYRLTSLLSTDGLLFIDGVNAGSLAAFSATYSVSDEVEFSPTLLIPIKSGFGQIPYTITIAVRSYF